MNCTLASGFGNEQMGIAIAILIALIPAIDAIVRWFGGGARQQIEPQPLRVKADAEFTPIKEFEAFRCQCHNQHAELRNEMHSIHARIDTGLTDQATKGEERAKALHKRIDELVRNTGELTGEIKHISTQVANAAEAASVAAVQAATAAAKAEAAMGRNHK